MCVLNHHHRQYTQKDIFPDGEKRDASARVGKMKIQTERERKVIYKSKKKDALDRARGAEEGEEGYFFKHACFCCSFDELGE